MDVAPSLHSQLYLVSYDSAHHEFVSRGRLLEFALRAAMLTDLYLTGHLEDVSGTARTTSASPPEDQVLRSVFDQVGSHPQAWEPLITRHDRTVRIVGDQLVANGTVCRRQHLILGFLPSARHAPTDHDTVTEIAAKAGTAVRRAAVGLPCEPRPLAAGLLAVHAQLDNVLTRSECLGMQNEIRHLTAAAIAPITALSRAIASYHDEVRAEMGISSV